MNLWQRLRLWHRACRYALRTERQEIALVRAAIGPGDLVLDVGAHKAAFTFWMARRVGSRGRVLAFEPNPLLADYLREVADCFSAGVVEVEAAALSNREGTAVLHFPGAHLGSASLELAQDVLQPPLEVPVTSLDRFLETHPPDRPMRLIKCDVESHELAVLQGAAASLRRDRPILLLESGDPQRDPQRLEPVAALLQSWGFEGHLFCGPRLVPLDQPIAGPQRRRPDDHCNYVFFHPARDRLLRSRYPYRFAPVTGGSDSPPRLRRGIR